MGYYLHRCHCIAPQSQVWHHDGRKSLSALFVSSLLHLSLRLVLLPHHVKLRLILTITVIDSFTLVFIIFWNVYTSALCILHLFVWVPCKGECGKNWHSWLTILLSAFVDITLAYNFLVSKYCQKRRLGTTSKTTKQDRHKHVPLFSSSRLSKSSSRSSKQSSWLSSSLFVLRY